MNVASTIAALVALVLLMVTGCRASAQPDNETPSVQSTNPPRTAAAGEETRESPSSATTDPPISSGLAEGDHEIDLTHEGRTRSYIVHVPPKSLEPWPVVIAIHGGGGTGRAFQEQNGLDAVADREGFLAVYPEGTGRLADRLHTWNSGDTCCGYAHDQQVDDVGFLEQVIADLGQRNNIDRGRVYMIGHSNGAMMAYRFAAERPELVTAIVAVGGAADLESPAASPAVALLHIHSIDDPRAIYEGGEGPPFPLTNRTVHHEPVMAGINSWALGNGCNPAPLLGERSEGAGGDAGQSFERLIWSDCVSGGAVEHLLLHGSGHGWPGVTVPVLLQRQLGEPTTLIDASEEAWEFVSQFSR